MPECQIVPERIVFCSKLAENGNLFFLELVFRNLGGSTENIS